MKKVNFQELFLDSMGLERAHYQVCIDEDLSPAYPLCVYDVGGAVVVALAPGLEEAMEPLLDAHLHSFDEALAFLFEGNVSAKKETVTGLYLEQAMQSKTIAGETRTLTSGDEEALQQLLEVLPCGEQLAGEVTICDDYTMGCFADGRLVCACGANVQGSLCDLSIVTHPDFRGKGLASEALLRNCANIIADGLLPFYRAENTNVASIALANSCGFQPGFFMTGGIVCYQ